MDEKAFADYWGGTGPTYEAQATRDNPALAAQAEEGPWWDGEKIHNPEAAAAEIQAILRREAEAEAEPW